MSYPTFNEELTLPAYTTHDWTEVQQWCNDNIGVWNKTWYKLGMDPATLAFSYRGHVDTYFFKNEQDRILFILRWS